MEPRDGEGEFGVAAVLERALRGREEPLRACGLTATLLADAPLPPERASTLLAAADALLEGALERGRSSGRAAELELGAAAVRSEPRLLRCWLADSLPGLPGPEPSLFAHLADGGPAPASGLAAALCRPAERAALGPLRFDLFSGPAGSVCWFDLHIPQFPPAPDREVPGWCPDRIYDGEEFLRRMNGDAEIKGIGLDSFLSEVPRLFVDLAVALAGEDAREQTRLCHSVKGAALNVSARRMGGVAAAAEVEARAGRAGRVAAILPRLEWEFGQVAAQLKRDRP